VVSAIEKQLVKKLCITSLSVSNYSIKIWVDDEERFISRIVNCVFRYDATNKRFGYCNIELNSTEVSKKPRLQFIGKFGILEREKIITAVLSDFEKSLEEIY
jgi:hypothetical protein